ncbi:TMEM175 family protein, partial [Streptomyces venetus]|uniref:TMEM175 family protein n=1 Tax=Streptomyces venetus TaxID=1701086 RepID=UPI003C2DEC58
MWTSRPDGGPGRLLTLADGVFAIAITLLVLDLYVPRGLDAAQYDQALRRLLPDLAAYALSVTVLGSFWHDHRRIFRDVREVDGQVITLSIAGLVPRQATFARQGAASGACSRRAGRKSSYWTY